LRVFLDSNIIIYYIEEHPYFFRKVYHYFDQALEGRITLVTSDISYIETFIPVLRKKRYDLIYKYDTIFTEICEFVNTDKTEEITEKAKYFIYKYNLKEYDAMQISAAIYSNCDKFVTADKKLTRVKEIKIELIK